MLGFAKKLVKQAEGIIAPEVDAEPTYGFRVMHVDSGSDAQLNKMEPFFDFIIAINGHPFRSQYFGETKQILNVEEELSPEKEFKQILNETAGRLVLEVWSAKGKQTRVVTLKNPRESVGMHVKWSKLNVSEHVWHVLEVQPNSPAFNAGLISHADYIIASESNLLEAGGEHLLGKVVSRTKSGESILFYVYNRDYNVVRPVRVFPSFDGKLGCGVGYGYLHALPHVSGNAPGAMLFDENQ